MSKLTDLWEMVPDQVRACAASLARVFLAACLTAYLATGESLLTLNQEVWRSIVAAGISAVALTVINALRRGETRFGRGARRKF